MTIVKMYSYNMAIYIYMWTSTFRICVVCIILCECWDGGGGGVPEGFPQGIPGMMNNGTKNLKLNLN